MWLNTLNLTINNSSTSSSTVTACDSFDWNGQTYTSSGSYTWTGTNSVGCDSATLNLTINNSSTSSSIITTCNSLIGMVRLTQVQVHILGLVQMVDVIVPALNLTINSSDTTSSYVTRDSWTWDGVTYTVSGLHTNSYYNIFMWLNTHLI